MTHSLTFEAIAEARAGPKWKSRWDWSWPAYETWFRSHGGDNGPSQAAIEVALRQYMPELVATHGALTRLAGGSDRVARFLSGWCPSAYLSGCSLAAQSQGGRVRLVRNYYLSPELNEGLLLRSEWTGRAVMGMVEFLGGLSDGINEAGLAVAIAYGGCSTVARGFGITMIVRYLLETCDDVASALARLAVIPSHMAYNLVLADRAGHVASVELASGGGMRRVGKAIATNHQHSVEAADRAALTRTVERRAHLELLLRSTAPEDLRQRFLEPPLRQDDYAGGFGTLFTAEYEPARCAMTLAWPSETWTQRLDAFREGRRTIVYAPEQTAIPSAYAWAEAGIAPSSGVPMEVDAWLGQAIRGDVADWSRFGRLAAWVFASPASGSHKSRILPSLAHNAPEAACKLR